MEEKVKACLTREEYKELESILNKIIKNIV